MALIVQSHLSAQVIEWIVCRVMGQFNRALKSLEETLAISEELGEVSGNMDTYGEIADIHADMGNYEQAGEVRKPSQFTLPSLLPSRLAHY